ncbi:MAG: hypothetical protein ACI8WB_004456 [Phenylobacterium sp.]|jgi:hypothetical protein
MTLSDRLENLNRQLSQDPYQISLLFDKVLTNVALGNKDAAKAALATLHRLPNIEAQLSTLDAIFDGSKRLIATNHYWFITPAECDENSAQQVIQCGHQHYDYLSSVCQNHNKPLLIIELVPLPYSWLDHSIDNLAIIKLSGLESTLSQHSAALAHELSHVFWPCKNRVLSEGIALYFENSRVPLDAFIPSVDAAKDFVDNYQGTMPSLAGLLSNIFKDDVFFEHRTQNSQEQKLMYYLSFLIIGAFVEHQDVATLSELIDKINTSEDKEALVVFQHFFNTTDLTLTQLLNLKTTTPAQTIDIHLIEDELRADRAAYQCNAYHRYYNKLKAKVAQSHCSTSKILLARVLLVMFAYTIINREEIELVALYELEEIAAQLLTQGLDIESAYFTARVDAIKLMSSESGIEKAIFCNRARSSFDVATQQEGLIHAEVCIDFAVFELYVPQEHGRNVGRATQLLQTAALDQRYTSEIQQIKQHFNI